MDETTTTTTTTETTAETIATPPPTTGSAVSTGPLPHRLARQGTDVTARELEILQGMSRGETGRETAERLGISLKTVEAHRARAFDRLGAKNAPHAIYLAIQRGIIPVALTVAA